MCCCYSLRTFPWDVAQLFRLSLAPGGETTTSLARRPHTATPCPGMRRWVSVRFAHRPGVWDVTRCCPLLCASPGDAMRCRRSVRHVSPPSASPGTRHDLAGASYVTLAIGAPNRYMLPIHGRTCASHHDSDGHCRYRGCVHQVE